MWNILTNLALIFHIHHKIVLSNGDTKTIPLETVVFSRRESNLWNMLRFSFSFLVRLIFEMKADKSREKMIGSDSVKYVENLGLGRLLFGKIGLSNGRQLLADHDIAFPHLWMDSKNWTKIGRKIETIILFWTRAVYRYKDQFEQRRYYCMWILLFMDHTASKNSRSYVWSSYMCPSTPCIRSIPSHSGCIC